MSKADPNPYNANIPGAGPFYGRRAELERLVPSIRNGRNAIAAVMGGRGIGKTSLALRIKSELTTDPRIIVHHIRRPAEPVNEFVLQLERLLRHPLSLGNPSESLCAAVDATKSRVVLLIDEVEALIRPAEGRRFLDNLRIAYEDLDGRLGVVIFGGSMLRELLWSDTSAFLRTADWRCLKGLTVDEFAAFIREPLHADVPDTAVSSWWERTGGHPFLMASLLERSVVDGTLTTDRLSASLHEILPRLESTLFPMWWDNLTPRGQQIYRTLLAYRRPLDRAEWVRQLGSNPEPWIEILETTGVVRNEGGQLKLHGSLFQTWFTRNHFIVGPDGTPVTVTPPPVVTRNAIAARSKPQRHAVPEPPPELVRALVDNRLVAIVGSGLTCAAGGPTWTNLLHGLVAEAERTKPHSVRVLAEALTAMDNGRYLDAASLIKAQLQPDFASSVVRQLRQREGLVPDKKAIRRIVGHANKSVSSLFAKRDPVQPLELRPTSSHRMLAHLGFRAVVTTNYDILIESAWPAPAPSVYSWSYEHLAQRIQEGSPFILKLHGDVRHPDDIILARQDYASVVFGSRAREALRALLATSKLFWVGYGHNDPDLDLLLDEVRTQLGATGGYAVAGEAETLTIERLKNAGIGASLLRSHADVPRYLRLLAEKAGRRLVFTVELGSSRHDDNGVLSLGHQLASALQRELQLHMTVWRVERDPSRIDMESSTADFLRLRELLLRRSPPLIGVLEALSVITVDGEPVT